MENPFPGMDPWMEDQWGDAHARMIIYACDQMRPYLPVDLRARVEERVFVSAGPPRRRGTRQPDLYVSERRGRPVGSPAGRATAAQEGGVALAQPLRLAFGVDQHTETFIEIRERRPSGRLVTVVEVLSPANKRRGSGRTEYVRKQRECLAAGVNLVEIDLLRGGRWTVVAPPDELPQDVGEPPYRVSVWRAADPDEVEFYPLSLRDRLPAIGVPLRETDADAPLDLQSLLNQTYVAGEYDDTDYAVDPVPRLSADDLAWARQLLTEKGLLG